MPQTAGRIIDRSYLLYEQLGEGGMGTVYRAKQLVSGREVALKLVSGRSHAGEAFDKGTDQFLRLSLAREFQTLASIHHPNVIRVLSYGFDDEVGSYFTMELLASSQNILQAAAGQPLAGKVELVAQLLRALVYVHQRGILHRDLKPSNILVVQGEVKLLDFGIAADVTTPSDLSGTLEYMAPEILQHQPPSVASDLYSFGVIFHQILSGRFPYSRKSLTRMLAGIFGEDSDVTFSPTVASMLVKYRELNEKLDTAETDLTSITAQFSAEIPDSLAQIVRKLLARNREDRYADARTTLKDLSAVMHIALPVETAATRESFLQATKLVGRDAELRLLTAALERAKAGQGSGFLMGGQSGIGKSRLISEVRTHALVAGIWAAEGQSVSHGGTYYQEWIPLLRELCFRVEVDDVEASLLKPLLPDIGEILERPIPDPAASKNQDWQTRLEATLVELLAKLSKPVLIVLEDLHWVRDESLSLLAHLTARIQSLPILFIGTFRSDESPHLPKMLPALEVIALQRLASSDIARLSASILGQAGTDTRLLSYLDQQTEGNAFFLVEIVRALAEKAGELREIGGGALPETILTLGIERIIERRLDRLSKPLRDMLEFSAILGRRLDLQVLERVFPELELRTALIECANVNVLESQGADWRFAHDKLREALLQKLHFNQRQALHERAAEHLEVVYAAEARAGKSATLAYHFHEAGAYQKALQYYRLAAENAASHNLTIQSRAHYAAAQKLLAQLPDTPELRRLSVDLAMKEVAAGLGYTASQDSLQLLSRAKDLLRPLVSTEAASAADRLRMARLEHFCGRVYQYTGQAKEAILCYKQATAMADILEDPELKVMSFLRMGLSLCFLGQFGEARKLLGGPIEQTVRMHGVHDSSMRGILYYCIALAGSGHVQQALRKLEEAHNIVQQINQPPCTLAFNGLQFLVYIIIADWPLILQTAQQNLKIISQQTDDPMYVMTYMDGIAWAQSHLGQPLQAIKSRQQALDLRRVNGGGLLPDWYDAAEAEILLNAGRSEDALRQAQKVVARSQEADQRFSQAIAERVWGCALARLGEDLHKAVEHFKASLDLSQSAEQVLNTAQTELWWGQLLRELENEAAARPHFHRAVEQLAAGGYTYALSQARLIASIKC